MKFTLRSTTTVAALALLAFTVPAMADVTPGWYVGGGGGVTDTPKEDVYTRSAHATANYHTGWNADIGGGYAWTNGWRAEGEAFYSRAVLKGIEGSGLGPNGNLANADMFMNGFYDFNLGSMFTPYVGLGVGVGVPSAKYKIGGTKTDDSDVDFAYQGIVGVSAQIDPNWAITADYRYIRTTDPRFSTYSSTSFNQENSSHNVLLGVRYSFAEPEPMKHAAYVAPAPAKTKKPVVAPVGQSYMVFFDFNKSELTPEAKTILAAAAKDFKAGHYVELVVTGHTDTVGSDKFNKALSYKRAAAVKVELEKLGIAAKSISSTGVGKDGLMVPTANGVREAQNRRAEIVLKK